MTIREFAKAVAKRRAAVKRAVTVRRKRVVKARCYSGCGRPAVYPPAELDLGTPRWCGVKCAAEYAANITNTVDADEWCQVCQEWHYPEDPYHKCEREDAA